MELQNVKFTKKRELIHDDRKFIEWRIGYSLCTVYKQSIKNNYAKYENGIKKIEEQLLK